jgi:DNA-directed RNA polymerase specialized sigma24 family protein
MNSNVFHCHTLRKSLLARALAKGCQPQDAEDVVQEVFAAVLRVGRWEELMSLAEKDQLRVLSCRLKSVLLKRWRDQHRQCRDSSCTVPLPDIEDQSFAIHITPATECDRSWAMTAIEDAMLRLRAEISESQWSLVESALCGDAPSPLEQGTSSRRRLAVYRARQRLRSIIPVDALREALCS